MLDLPVGRRGADLDGIADAPHALERANVLQRDDSGWPDPVLHAAHQIDAARVQCRIRPLPQEVSHFLDLRGPEQAEAWNALM